MELHIANAAYDAGFNTRKHEALFNLIWAVKRTAIRTLRLSHFHINRSSHLIQPTLIDIVPVV